MTFEKALEAMKHGERVRRKSASKNIYCFIRKDTREIVFADKECLYPFRRFSVDSSSVLADDWEIYEEPEKEKPTEEVGISLTEVLVMIDVIAYLLKSPYNRWSIDELGFRHSQIMETIEISKKAILSNAEIANVENEADKFLYKTHEKSKMPIEKVIRLLKEIRVTTIEHEEEFSDIFAYFNVSDATKALEYAVKALEIQSQCNDLWS